MDGTHQRKEVYGEKKKKKNKVEEIQLTNLVSPGSLASKNSGKTKVLKAYYNFQTKSDRDKVLM